MLQNISNSLKNGSTRMFNSLQKVLYHVALGFNVCMLIAAFVVIVNLIVNAGLASFSILCGFAAVVSIFALVGSIIDRFVGVDDVRFIDIK